MNDLRFEIITKQGEKEPFQVCRIFIDNQNLLDILTKFEMPFAKNEGYPELA